MCIKALAAALEYVTSMKGFIAYCYFVSNMCIAYRYSSARRNP
jgi:hypothetical protein